MHFIRQAVDVSVRKKNASNTPTITAPTTLVAANVIARSTSDAITVPTIPVKSTVKTGHMHLLVAESGSRATDMRVTAR